MTDWKFFSGVLIALLACLALVPGLIRLSLRWGVTDHPSDRKRHEGVIPLCGGVAIFTAALLGWLFGSVYLAMEDCAFFLAGFLLLMVGLLDDLRELSSRWRLFCQALAALFLVYVGQVSLTNFGDLLGTGHSVRVEDGWAVCATIFCVIGLINAFNMIDGLDGLAGGLAMIALFWFLLIAGGLQGMPVVTLILAFMGAVTGFLVYNLRYPGHAKASVFMGDAGSTLLGLLMAFLSIRLTQGGGESVQRLPPIHAVWVLGLPILDTLSLILRRIMKGRSPFSADRDHLHHILMRLGFSVEQTVWILCAISASLGAVAYLSWHAGVQESILFWGALGIFLGYVLVQLHAWRVMRWLRKSEI